MSKGQKLSVLLERFLKLEKWRRPRDEEIERNVYESSPGWGPYQYFGELIRDLALEVKELKKEKIGDGRHSFSIPQTSGSHDHRKAFRK